MAFDGITPELKRRMNKVRVFEHDVREDFIRSTGPGGQNVNKVSSCVSLRHVPTGIEVKCQESRSQRANRVKAWWLLVRKIEEHYRQRLLIEVQRRERIRRRNRPRPLALQEKILHDKRQRKSKKEMRRKIENITD